MTEERQLSEREREILRLMATGATNQQIAVELGISINTVKVHLRNIFAKIGARSRTEATMHAVRTGIVEVAGGVRVPTVPTVQPAPQPLPPAPAPADARRRQLVLSIAAIGVGALVVALLVVANGQGRAPAPPAQPTAEVLLGRETLSWSEIPSLPDAHEGGAAVALDGRIYVVAGADDSGVTNALWRYDPASRTWAALADKPTPVRDVRAAVLGGRIFIPGGLTATGAPSDRLEIFDPLAGEWVVGAALPAPRSGYALAVVEGRLYLFGGRDAQSPRAEVFAYDPATDEWQTQTVMPTPRAFADAVVVDSRVYVLGGEDASGPLAINEQYTPAAEGRQSWASLAPMPFARSRFGAGPIANFVFVVGGTDDPTVLYYDVRIDHWQISTPTSVAVGDFPLVTARDNVLFVAQNALNQRQRRAYEMRLLYTVTIPSP
ncbi:MAG: hypothetical protein KGS47_09260 [Chloroflexi bacterium]|nr:hypothetical protein [Chloroflexota bacterium]